MYVFQAALVLTLLALFRLGFADKWLVPMPGPAWAEHGHGIVLCLIPYVHWSVLVLWAVGLFLYIDDFYQHRRRTYEGQENYRTPFHLWAWYTLRVNKLFNWLGIE